MFEAGSLDKLHVALVCMLDCSLTDGIHLSALSCAAVQL